MMLINDVFYFKAITSTEDEEIKLECSSTTTEIDDNTYGYKLVNNISSRIAFDIYRKENNRFLGRVFVESMDVNKYINIFLNIHNFDRDIAQRIIFILEKCFKAKLIYVSTDPKNKEYHKLLEDLDYIYQKDYIYPDIKLYFKEMK